MAGAFRNKRWSVVLGSDTAVPLQEIMSGYLERDNLLGSVVICTSTRTLSPQLSTLIDFLKAVSLQKSFSARELKAYALRPPILKSKSPSRSFTLRSETIPVCWGLGHDTMQASRAPDLVSTPPS